MRGTKELFIRKSSGGRLYSSFPREKQSQQQNRHHQTGVGKEQHPGLTALSPGQRDPHASQIPKQQGQKQSEPHLEEKNVQD